MFNEINKSMDGLTDNSAASDIIQMVESSRGETDQVRLGRLEKRVNVAVKRLTRPQQAWLLEQLKESDLARHLTLFNGQITRWYLTGRAE